MTFNVFSGTLNPTQSINQAGAAQRSGGSVARAEMTGPSYA